MNQAARRVLIVISALRSRARSGLPFGVAAILCWALALGACVATPAQEDSDSSEESLRQARSAVIVISRALSLTPTTLTAGTTVQASVTYSNTGRTAGTLNALYITSRPPGGTAAAGPFVHFAPNLGAVTLQPGTSVTLNASRTFTSSDPTGAWFAYSTYQDASGAWVNGPSVSFQVGATSTPEPPPASATQYWSIAFYPGWVQNRIPASAIDYSPWTHIFHFGMYPGSRGEVLLADMQSTAYPPDAVARAHAAGKKIVLVIGGESTGPAFTTATSSTYRATFVKNIVATMQRYGYDGVDVDWEEGVIDAQLVALMQELRTTLNALGTAPLLTIEVISGLVAPATAAKVSGLVDAVNVMSYWSSGLDQFTAFHDAGVPASKIVLGIGLASVYRDTTQALVQAKVDLARQYGMRGVDGWQLGDLTGSTDPRLVPLRNLVASNPK